MNKCYMAVCLAALSLCITNVARADNYGGAWFVSADTIHADYSSFDNPSASLSQALAGRGTLMNSSHTSATGFGVHVGAYLLGVVAEASYWDLGRASYTVSSAGQPNTFATTDIGLKAYGIDYALQALPMFSEHLFVHGRLGLAVTELTRDTSVDLAGARSQQNHTDQGLGLNYGVGLTYFFSQRFMTELEVGQFLRTGDSQTGEGNVNYARISLAYLF